VCVCVCVSVCVCMYVCVTHSTRYALFANDGVVEKIVVEDSPGDVLKTRADSVLALLPREE